MEEISYRALEPEDVHLFGSAESLYRLTAGKTEHMPDEETISEWVDSEYKDVFMAFQDEEPIGSAVIDYGSTGEFCYDVVDPRHQGEGIGTGLFEVRRQAAEEYGCEKLLTSAVAHHTGSQKIYERNGFIPLGIIAETGKQAFDEDEKDSTVLMANYLEHTGSKNINIPKDWHDFVENRLDNIPEIGPRNYSNLNHLDRAANMAVSDDSFVIDFVTEGISLLGRSDGLESIYEEIENFSSDSRTVNVNLGDRKSADVIRHFQEKGFIPSGYIPHWLGSSNNDYVVLQDQPDEPVKAVLTDRSVKLAEDLDLVQEKEKQDGEWVTLLG